MSLVPFDKHARNRMLGNLAGRLIRFVVRTSRRTSGSVDGDALLPDHPAILAMWHGEFMLLAPLAPKSIPISNMVALHGDAELIGAALQTFDMGLVRGGGAAGRRKDRGGTKAFLEALQLLRNGTTVAMTADIPSGTPRRVGLGIIKLAQKSGRPIVPVAVASSRFVTVDTWSRMTINLPFSRLGVAVGDPIRVARNDDQDALDAARLRLEQELDLTTERAYTLARADRVRATPPAGLKPGDRPTRAGLPLHLYRGLTRLFAGALPRVLAYRERKGKEDPARRDERLGIAAAPRPAGTLIWLHAASVGETNAILPLMDVIRRRRPGCRFLLTTGTVTSAALAARRLPAGDIHQFATWDVPANVDRFLDHWRPDVAVLTESEIWPNTILAAHARKIPLVLVNARMSERSYRRWRRYRRTARALLGRFTLILAQNERLARRFRELGGRDVHATGNLKVDAPPLPVDTNALEALRTAIAGRPVLLAASTHPGEEKIVLEAFATLSASDPQSLLIIVPRHPERGAEVATEAATTHGFNVARRAAGEPVSADTHVYVADTLGELGVFYTLCKVAFIGGSLIPHGGQNPLEAIRFDTAVISGPAFENFADAYKELRRRQGVVIVSDAGELGDAAAQLLNDDQKYQALTLEARSAMSEMTGALDQTADALTALIQDQGGATAIDDNTPAQPSRTLSRAS